MPCQLVPTVRFTERPDVAVARAGSSTVIVDDPDGDDFATLWHFTQHASFPAPTAGSYLRVCSFGMLVALLLTPTWLALFDPNPTFRMAAWLGLKRAICCL